MFKNYITVALRNLKRQKLYAFINIFGLALGIACCILMTLFVKHEWSHDRFHENRDQIYRIVAREINKDGEETLSALHSFTFVEALTQSIPGIEQASGFMWDRVRITGSDRTFRERFGEVHPSFLKIFSFPLLAGDLETALNQPDNVVISKSMAQKFFGDPASDYRNIIGKPLTFHGHKDQTFTITAIMQDVPQTSSLPFDFLIPISNHKKYGMRVDTGGTTVAYILVAKNQDLNTLASTIQHVSETTQAERLKGFRSWGRIRDTTDGYTIYLQPLNDVYWDARIGSYELQGNPKATYIMFGIAILVLLIACSNFMTLSISQSTSRATEVGVRKVIGASRQQLMQQFWSEAVFLSFCSLGFGLALAELFLPIFNELLQQQLQIAYFKDGQFIVLLAALMIIVGFFAGSYPAVILSRFQPIHALKGQTQMGGRSKITRTFIILQYAASIALIICTGIIMQQQQYMQNKDLGYNREQVVVVTMRGMETNIKQIAERYKKAIQAHPQVINTTISDRTFTSGSGSMGYVKSDGTEIVIRHINIDEDYIPTLNLMLLVGRNFSSDHPTDPKESILINEALAKALNDPDPIGKPLQGFEHNNMKNPIIIGIVRDFHTGSLHEKIPPLIMQMRYSFGSPSILVRIHPNDISNTLNTLKQTWQEIAPRWAFNQSFLDENLNRQYREELRWQNILTYSATFAIAIACLGLFGLVSLAVSRRTKEIGIRKVLGASVPNLVNLLTIDFIKLLLIANIIAWPIAYYAMEKWLTNFAYHIELGIGIFALSGALALAVALLTVGTQTFKAARSNPVDALRYE